MLSVSMMNKLSYHTAATVAEATVAAALASSSGAPSEAPSEISSAESTWSDIKAIANKLGVENSDELHTERFKIDRQKLEQLLQEPSPVQNMNGAEHFFDNIMKKTITYVSWPCRLKIGAKSKKDPHVRIVGKPEEVAKAKIRVLARLDSRGSRVIMKIDVSYTDHSFIIGRGGWNIKTIMEETNTHIHFPDSNRSSSTEKSNQVSLCGSLEGVERARSRVRLSAPLLISFELPAMPVGTQPDRETPYVTMVEREYNVQVIFTSRPKLHSSLVMIKGCEKDSVRVQEATQTLINLSCGAIANQIMVQMQLEISPQHHEVVKGINNANLLNIMQHTTTKIFFPDLSDMNIKPLKKSQVTIMGTIDNAYKARQQLLGNLPISLIFDFPDAECDVSTIKNLRSKYGVHIGLRQRKRENTLAIVVKGLEKFIDKIYEARQEILRLTTPRVICEIPKTYFMPQDENLSDVDLALLTTLLDDSTELHNNNNNYNNVIPNGGPIAAAATAVATIKNSFHTPIKVVNIQGNANNFNDNLQPKCQPTFDIYERTPPGICPPTQKYMQLHNRSLHQQQPHEQHFSHNNNYLNVQQKMQPSANQPLPPSIPISPRNSISNNTSGYQSYSSSTNSLEQAYSSGVASCAGYPMLNNNQTFMPYKRSCPFSPNSHNSNEVICSRFGRRASDGVLLGLNNSESGMSHGTPTGVESLRNLHYGNLKNTRAFEIDLKRYLAYKAMERSPVAGELRTPTSHWMGMNLSRTSPVPLEATSDVYQWPHQMPLYSGQNSPYNLSTTTGLIDSTPTNRRLNLGQHKDIRSLLIALGLEHYIKLFVMNEIDLDILTNMNENNLIELGITAFGPRKKLMLAIASLQANEDVISSISNNGPSRFSGSAAPGAERRPSNQW